MNKEQIQLIIELIDAKIKEREEELDPNSGVEALMYVKEIEAKLFYTTRNE